MVQISYCDNLILPNLVELSNAQNCQYSTDDSFDSVPRFMLLDDPGDDGGVGSGIGFSSRFKGEMGGE